MGNNTRSLIFGNGTLDKKFLSYIKPGDFIIGVDRAAHWLITNKIIPDLAIGDFDSTTTREFQKIKKISKQIKTYSPQKDFTDMELAIQHARGDTIIFGWSGTRVDHMLGALQVAGNHVLIDTHNRIRLIGRGKTIIEKASYRYVSLIPYTKIISLSLTGFRYNLDHKIIKQGTSLGVSNEIVGEKGQITIFSGRAWVVESND